MQEFTLPRLSTGFRNRWINTISLTRFKKDIVHITGDTYYAILGAVFCKRLITIHDLSFLDRTSGISREILKLFWVRIPVRYAHIITVVSESTKNAILREVKVAPGKIRVVYNFVDPVYQPVDRNFNSACPRILQVGTDFNKNIGNLAMALEGVNCELVIVGHLSEEQHGQLKKHRIRYENKFALRLDQLHAEYVKADLLTFISTVEGFGLPVIEAQSTGLPVVTSNCSSMPEVAGKGAILVDPFDVASMRSGIMDMISNTEKRNMAVQEGLVNARKYSMEHVALQYLDIYNELCSQ